MTETITLPPQNVSSPESVDLAGMGHIVRDPKTGETLHDQDGLHIELTQEWASEKVSSDLMGFDTLVDVLEGETAAVNSGDAELDKLARSVCYRLNGVLSPLSKLYVDKTRRESVEGVIESLASKKGISSEELLAEYFKVHLYVGENEDGVAQYDHFTPDTIEDYFEASRLQVYQKMQSGDDILIHESHHGIDIIESGSIKPKAKHEPGKVRLVTGLINHDIPMGERTSDHPGIAGVDENTLGMGQHSLFIHFAEHDADTPSIASPGGYGPIKFIFNRSTVMEHAPVRMVGPAEAHHSRNGEEYAEILIDEATVDEVSQSIRDILGINTLAASDVSFAASMESAEQAVEFEYPIAEGIVVVSRLGAEAVISDCIKKGTAPESWPVSIRTGDVSLSQWLRGITAKVKSKEVLPESSSPLAKKAYDDMNKLLEQSDITEETLRAEAVKAMFKDVLVEMGISEQVVSNVHIQTGYELPAEAIQQLSQASPTGKRRLLARVSNDEDKFDFTQEDVEAIVPW